MLKKLSLLFVALCFVYGGGRLYYALTDGFSTGNIKAHFAKDARWKTTPLPLKRQSQVIQALNQEYTYLGKGCQAYAFASRDGRYVLKFFKYQRYRCKPWIDALAFLPLVDSYRQNKNLQKKAKLDKIFQAWKLAFEHLPDETGVLFVNLDRHPLNLPPVILCDKMGNRHAVNIDDYEFLLQRRATMLCPALADLMKEKKIDEAKGLLDNLLVMLLSEYARGFADNDHALMQNTGVVDGKPVHVDVGLFIHNPIVKDPAVYQKELYHKLYKFSNYLSDNYENLALHLKARIIGILGVDYYYMGDYVHKDDIARIPHIDII